MLDMYIERGAGLWFRRYDNHLPPLMDMLIRTAKIEAYAKHAPDQPFLFLA